MRRLLSGTQLAATALSIAALTASAAAREVEQQVADDIQQEVTDRVERRVTEEVEQQVTNRVERQVADDVERQVTDSVERQVTDDVERQVTDNVERQVTDDVEQRVSDNVERQVADDVEQRVSDNVERQVADDVERQVGRSVERRVEDTLEHAVTRGLEGRTGEEAAARSAANRASETLTAVEAALRDGPAARAGRDRPSPAAQAGPAKVAQSSRQERGAKAPARSPARAARDEAATERFAAAVTDTGWTVERATWVVLVPREAVDQIERWSLRVREQRELPGLDSVLLRVDAPADRELRAFARDAARAAPGTRVDRNHVYRQTREAAAGDVRRTRGATFATFAPSSGTDAPPRSPKDAETRPRSSETASRMRLGIIDSALARDHPALAEASIVAREFVSYDARRPADHGTAVASLLVGNGPVRGLLPAGTLHAASVFFVDSEGRTGATTADLLSALSWLREQDVNVVNMSLAGPPNALLERAVETAVGDGMLVVAAVGNNGPAGRPLYPAAYPAVVGVTAVDASHEVYRYANRGRQVAFSAPGVDVRVADASGGYRTDAGTSLAAPIVTAILARRGGGAGFPAATIEALKADALDLGPPGFDEIYGFGLVRAGSLAP